MEFVASGFGHGVDVARREAAILHVIGRQFDRHILDGIIRERHTLSGIAITVETEVVIQLHTVDREAVETRIRADALDTIDECLVNIDTRIDTDNVLEVAVYGRSCFQVGEIERRRWADRKNGTGNKAGFGNDNLVNFTGCFFQADIESGCCAQARIHICDQSVFELIRGDTNLVRAASA